ncbi:hypothetical protein R6Z07F_020177 [Ovis aries]
MTAAGAVSAGLEARRWPFCSVSPPSISGLESGRLQPPPPLARRTVFHRPTTYGCSPQCLLPASSLEAKGPGRVGRSMEAGGSREICGFPLSSRHPSLPEAEGGGCPQPRLDQVSGDVRRCGSPQPEGPSQLVVQPWARVQKLSHPGSPCTPRLCKCSGLSPVLSDLRGVPTLWSALPAAPPSQGPPVEGVKADEPLFFNDCAR